MSSQFPPPPVFGMHGSEEGIPRHGIVSLVDIFDDFLFANDRMGAAGTTTASARAFDAHKDPDDDEEDEDDDFSNDDSDDGRRRKRPRGSSRAMTEEQKVERRYKCFALMLNCSVQ